MTEKPPANNVRAMNLCGIFNIGCLFVFSLLIGCSAEDEAIWTDARTGPGIDTGSEVGPGLDAGPQSDQTPPGQRTILFDKTGGATGIYIGGGMMLTNHHAISGMKFAMVSLGQALPAEDRFTFFDDDGVQDPGERGRSGYYCVDSDTTPPSYQFSETDLGEPWWCLLADRSSQGVARFGVGMETAKKEFAVERMLFASDAHDLALLQLTADEAALASEPLNAPPLALEPKLPADLTSVRIIGYPGGTLSDTICEVEEALVKSRTDTDSTIPEYARRTLDGFFVLCDHNEVGSGASGSGVYHPDTGALLGVYSASDPYSEPKRRVLVSAVGAWLPLLRQSASEMANSFLIDWSHVD